jgi:hypothetical protein
MPKPPESGLQIRPRAPHPLHPSACLRKASFERAGFSPCNSNRDDCQQLVTFKLTFQDENGDIRLTSQA